MRGRKVPSQLLTLEHLDEGMRKLVQPQPRYTAPTFTEAERQAACEDVAQRMYAAGMGWHLDTILKLTNTEIDMARMYIPFKLPEPTPAERGVLDRYQARRTTRRNK